MAPGATVRWSWRRGRRGGWGASPVDPPAAGRPVSRGELIWGEDAPESVVALGGTLHVDEAAGRPEHLATTLANLRRLRPFHGAVPAGFAALPPALESAAG
ncbi:hypothetical protein ACFPK1_12490 [Actinomycetospora rhizophila]|uniref:Uncharacterized protein n=1 Tax=Actinomycetospora rhizophila TaxID=1416876 RepID=A0ABV9ZFU5_9PSEU